MPWKETQALLMPLWGSILRVGMSGDALRQSFRQHFRHAVAVPVSTYVAMIRTEAGEAEAVGLLVQEVQTKQKNKTSHHHIIISSYHHIIIQLFGAVFELFGTIFELFGVIFELFGICFELFGGIFDFDLNNLILPTRMMLNKIILLARMICPGGNSGVAPRNSSYKAG